jgi:hypothetical protein
METRLHYLDRGGRHVLDPYFGIDPDADTHNVLRRV